MKSFLEALSCFGIWHVGMSWNGAGLRTGGLVLVELGKVVTNVDPLMIACGNCS